MQVKVREISYFGYERTGTWEQDISYFGAEGVNGQFTSLKVLIYGFKCTSLCTGDAYDCITIPTAYDNMDPAFLE